MAYVYQHFRLDTGEVFYVGIGKTRYRFKTKQARNDLWYKIVAKAGFRAEILYDNIEWGEATKIEIELIKKYGRINNGTGILANMTDGGDGNLGCKHSPEALKKISESSKGRPGYWKGKKIPKEITEKVRQAQKGRPNYKLRGRTYSEETKKKMSLAHKGICVNIGVPFTEERKANISKARKGQPAHNKGKPGLAGELNGMFGKKHSIESRNKNSDAQRKCPVIKLDKSGRYIAGYSSITDAARENNCFATGIQATCKDKWPSYKKFVWRYK